MVDEVCRVLEHVDIGAGYRRILFDAPRIAAEAQPGQFVHLRVPALESSALRRPFSVFDAEDGKVTILYKRVGRGTEALAAVAEGGEMDVLGPLGRGFPLECRGAPLLVGGGYGVAPLHFLAKRLARVGMKPILFVGGRTKDDLLALDDFAALGVEVRIATNDGSVGAKGFVTGPLDEALAELAKDNAPFSSSRRPTFRSFR